MAPEEYKYESVNANGGAPTEDQVERSTSEKTTQTDFAPVLQPEGAEGEVNHGKYRIIERTTEIEVEVQNAGDDDDDDDDEFIFRAKTKETVVANPNIKATKDTKTPLGPSGAPKPK